MPASAQSLRITEAYRAHLQALTQVAQTEARTAWAKLEWDDLRASYVAVGDRVEVVVRRAQTDGVRVTTAYLAAYLTSELGEPVAVPKIRSADYVGKAFAGGPLRESLDTPLFSVLRAIKEGKPDPMGRGASTLRVNVDLDVKAAPRQALLDAIAADDRFVGWVRAVRGTCAACAEKADSEPSGEVYFEVHPDCQCVTEPRVKLARDADPRKAAAVERGEAMRRWAKEKPRALAVFDEEWVETRQHVADYYRLSPKVRKVLNGERYPDNPIYTGRISVGGRPVAEFPGAEKFAGEHPRGWYESATFENVAGVFDPVSGKMFVGAAQGSGSTSVMIHEIGHAVDEVLRARTDVNPKFLSELEDFHRELFDKLSPYLQQGGPAGRAGTQEFFAEASADVVKREDWATEHYGKDFVTWMKKQWKNYGELFDR